jgi:predicted ATPase
VQTTTAPPAPQARTATVPEPVRAALASELSALSEPSLLLLRAAAVASDPFDARMAATVADMGEANALDAVDELLQAELVFPTAVAGQFGFRHPIARATVYELTTIGWRARAHGRLAALLAARGRPMSSDRPARATPRPSRSSWTPGGRTRRGRRRWRRAGTARC